MIYLILTIIILLFVSYLFVLKQVIKAQGGVIEEQKDKINRERIAHKYTKYQLDTYIKSYHQAVDKIHQMNGMMIEDLTPIESGKKEYELDDILNEISKKGIKNVSKDKLDFLKKFGKK